MIAEIAAMRQRVEAAGTLADLLVTAEDAFAALRSACRACEQQSGELFAAFAFAGAAAAQGKLALAGAPSLPPAPNAGSAPEWSVQEDLDDTADALATLAQALQEALVAGVRAAERAGDQAACAQAAADAAQVLRLVRRGGP